MRLRCTSLEVAFPTPEGPLPVLTDLTLATREREFLTIVGPSGCGKTTLLRALAGLLQPSSGTIERVHSAGAGDRVLLVFQEGNLFPWLTALDNAAFGLEMQGVSREERECRCRKLLERVGLGGREKSYPHELSTGMRQRVALVRAFLSDPAVLLMDEPFGALDYQTRLLMQQQLLALWEEEHRTIVFVTHDVDEAILLSDRILVLGPRPSTVVDELTVTAARPRDPAGPTSPEVIELKRRILAKLALPFVERR